MSAVTPASQELIQIYFRSSVLKDAGVAPIDRDKLPIKVADAFVLISQEENRVKAAISEHEHYDANRK